MFMGHYAAAFAAKRVAPELPLPFCFVACELIDYFWGLLVLTGVERMRVVPNFNATNWLDLYFMPYTHSLPAAVIWSAGMAALAALFIKPSPRRTRIALVIGVTVSSHWLLDFVVHLPDLPLLFDSMKVGLGLWDYRYPALALELVALWAGVLVCLRPAGDLAGRYLLLAVFMSVVQVLSLVLPQPGSSAMTAAQILSTYVTVTFCAWLVERKRAAPATA
jgi:hypothetical protein